MTADEAVTAITRAAAWQHGPGWAVSAGQLRDERAAKQAVARTRLAFAVLEIVECMRDEEEPLFGTRSAHAVIAEARARLEA